eukprot:TRINITY_DN11745_c0_g2_i1.p1 TRINITY_DN11745_c0_g2~~TRINITY_DN11745_c0_g2_i1.p1  ORF type:complete len:289 (+),score=43.56 TRINITY_DN11745_c0_g2_i1:330-1196(+)
MAFLLIGVIIVARRNPQVVAEWKEKVKRSLSGTGLINEPESTPSLLRSANRSDSEVKGELEATVLSITGLDGFPLLSTSSASGFRVDNDDRWEIDDVEDSAAAAGVAQGADSLQQRIAKGNTGGQNLAARSEKAGADRKIRFLVFEENPESIQLFLNVYKRTPSGERVAHLAVANVPAARAMLEAPRPVEITARLCLESEPDRPIASIQMSLSFQSQHPFSRNSYGSSSDFPSSGPIAPLRSRKSAPAGLKKKGWGFSLSSSGGHQRRYSRAEQDDDGEDAGGYSAFL